MSKKWLTALVFCVLLIGFCLIFILFSNRDTPDSFGKQQVGETDVDKVSSVDAEKTSTPVMMKNEINGMSPNKDFNVDSHLKQLAHEQDSWKRKSGYFDEVDLSLYAAYDAATIEQLANSGDLLALEILARKFTKENFEKAIQTRLISAARGSTSALVDMVSAYQVKSWRKGLSEDDRLQLITQMLVNAEVAAMRGDRNGVVLGLLEMKNNNIVLAPKQVDLIHSRSHETYRKLESKRKELGLAPFDNTPDPLTEVQMDLMIGKIPDSSGWSSKYRK